MENPIYSSNVQTDLTFFTNEPGQTLLDRFKKTLKHVKFFDVLVGYFRTTGFYRLYDALESIEKIRILVGMKVDPTSFEILESVQKQKAFDFESHKKIKQKYSEATISELENSEDSYKVELGIQKFIEFLQNGKLQIKAYPSGNLHAKVYISRFSDDYMDYGRVITGSSNFSESGLVANREFNVELKNSADVKFALERFEELWKDAVDVSEEYVDTITKHTWLNDRITPYELYLKFLYEYFKEDINLDEEDSAAYLPEGFLDLKYQKQAVVAARKILDAYNGVFIADVVGMGKTYIAALLAQQLPGKILIICPPVLQEYWYETFFNFGVRGFKVKSHGKLDQIIKKGYDQFDYVIVDEAHRFRNEVTQGYEKLHQICWGKKVILVSATPLNNTVDDIYSQLKLFQIPKKSTIPGVPNLERFFNSLKKRLNQYEKQDPEYVETVKSISEEVRDKVLKYVMIRRTRTEVMNYFSEDLRKQGLTFPEIDDPMRIIYTFDDKTNIVFNQTVELLKQFTYSRYTPLLYLKKPLSEFEKQSQRNVGGFMKSILVKRLESSFYAFKKTLRRFVESYEKFIDMYNSGTVYISKKVNVYDLLDSDNEAFLLKLVEEEKVQKYNASEFIPQFIHDLKNDLETLKNIEKLWLNIHHDPKLNKFIEELKQNTLLRKGKLLVFTESKETGEYLLESLNKAFPNRVLFYCSDGGIFKKEKKSPAVARDLIRENFDPNNKAQSDQIRILISTDVLSEGVNLHRSNMVVNYDLPWNPAKVMQRVGRVNRVKTEHSKIHIFNFFPTATSEPHLGLEDSIKAKIQAFHDTLGEDAKYLTEEEVLSSHKLFGDALYKKLTDRKSYQGEEEEEKSELEYLHFIREIRDQQADLFEK
ncbi:MAG: helicase, partial [Calditrichaeota bacterium]